MPRAPLLVLVSIMALAAATALAGPTKGFWCYTHHDGDLAVCAPEAEQCEASLHGFNSTAKALGDEPITSGCVWQATAWELRTKTKRTGPPRFYPNKKMCTKALEKGESCRLVKK